MVKRPAAFLKLDDDAVSKRVSTTGAIHALPSIISKEAKFKRSMKDAYMSTCTLKYIYFRIIKKLRTCKNTINNREIL